MIWKFPISGDLAFSGVAPVVIHAPRVRRWLHFGLQDGEPFVWAEMDDSAYPLTVREYHLLVVATGAASAFIDRAHIGTVTDYGPHNLVLHLFGEEVPF